MAGILLPAGCCCGDPCIACEGLPNLIDVALADVTMCECLDLPAGGIFLPDYGDPYYATMIPGTSNPIQSMKVTYPGLSDMHTLRLRESYTTRCQWNFLDKDAATLELFASDDCTGTDEGQYWSYTFDVWWIYQYLESVASPYRPPFHTLAVYGVKNKPLEYASGPLFSFFESTGMFVLGHCETITSTANNNPFNPAGPPWVSPYAAPTCNQVGFYGTIATEMDGTATYDY